MIFEYIDVFLLLKCIRSGVLLIALPAFENLFSIESFFEKDYSTHFVYYIVFTIFWGDDVLYGVFCLF